MRMQKTKEESQEEKEISLVNYVGEGTVLGF